MHSYAAFHQSRIFKECRCVTRLSLHWHGFNTLVLRPEVVRFILAHRSLCYLILASLYLFLCTQMFAISFLLLMFDWSVPAFIIASFSEQQRSQNLFPGAYLLHFFMTDHYFLRIWEKNRLKLRFCYRSSYNFCT